jgi:hypothetical protein
MAQAESELASFRTAWWQRLLAEKASYELTRFAVLRLLALVYLVAFLVLLFQMDPLLGSRGLLPIGAYLGRVHQALGAEAYWKLPTLFWLSSSDGAMHVLCWTGIVLSAAALLGATNAFLQLALWAIYMSFVHAGQIFYGYGWEIQLLETGTLAAILCPVRTVAPFPKTQAPVVAVWLLRWLIFRIMLGAALIKLRNDVCWRDLTCLDFHFETQPNPAPLAWWAHHAPRAVHVAGVIFNHLAEAVAPWFVFAFRRWRIAAGCVLVAFQLTLIASGNLSFLNWLTIVPALACFDDAGLVRLLPRRRREPLLARFAALAPGRVHGYVTAGYAVLVAVLSVVPMLNLLSSSQVMNSSFDPLDLVNTYGAFGSVDRRRYEVILEGTRDEVPDESARWEEYELPCMPGDVRRRPCIVTPYHYRLDWQMWFVGNGAARGGSLEDGPWLVHLVWDLLAGDASPKKLLARDPFPDAPPRWIRADVWHYRFSASRADGAWWERQRVGPFMAPIAKDDPWLRRYVAAYGWADLREAR